MTLLERYVLKIASSAFLACLLGLTGVIWITTALRELDLVASKGQTLLVFLQVTLLSMPALLMIVAPVALFVAVMYTLNRLNQDSELIVMSAAGIAPWRVARPLLMLAVLVAALLGWTTIVAIPESFRSLRDIITQVRADVVSKFLQEGRFTTLDQGITFHFRQRAADGSMHGLIIHDQREPERQSTYLAERGMIVEVGRTPYLVLEEGSVHRFTPNETASVIRFERYAIDLGQFSAEPETVVLKPRERSTWELLNVDPNEAYARWNAGRFRSELHDRFATPLYALASLAIAFAALGVTRTTRQGRGAAIAAAVAGIVLLRVAGFGAASLAGRSAAFVPLMYLVPLLACGIALSIIAQQLGIIRWPRALTLPMPTIRLPALPSPIGRRLAAAAGRR